MVLSSMRALTKQEIHKKLADNEAQIRSYGVKTIGLFGSFVRNEQKRKSDIDILVEFEKGKITFDNYMHLKFFLEDLLGHKVDLVIRDDLKPQLRQYILREVEYAKEF
jgi:predicted nucleotidyltransferase